MTIKDLKKLRTRVDKVMSSKRDRARSELRERIAEIAQAAGFNLADIVGTKRNGRGRGASSKAKYVHPKNPALIWSGRGRRPKWLAEKLKSGTSVERFRA